MTTPMFSLEPGVVKSAILSPCGTYRYVLHRQWDTTLPVAGFVMLNPSTADARVDDPTIRRCIGFARSWGYGAILVRNLYALRGTDPAALWKYPDPVGPDNDGHLLDCVRDDLTVCAWGSHGRRGDTVLKTLSNRGVALHYLRLTKAGVPGHPLYLPGELTPIPLPAVTR